MIVYSTFQTVTLLDTSPMSHVNCNGGHGIVQALKKCTLSTGSIVLSSVVAYSCIMNNAQQFNLNNLSRLAAFCSPFFCIQVDTITFS